MAILQILALNEGVVEQALDHRRQDLGDAECQGCRTELRGREQPRGHDEEEKGEDGGAGVIEKQPAPLRAHDSTGSPAASPSPASPAWSASSTSSSTRISAANSS